MSNQLSFQTSARRDVIDHNADAPPVPIPDGHVGEFVIPGTGRLVYWTGRVAIGLRHQPQRCREPSTQSSLWIQRLMLGARNRVSSFA